ncbi:putative ybgA [Gossypium arboreum]|uniref:Putative ybgA n=1 Tax=Gossypium arboreum TaxID=29729 RepID=A0A0B0NBL1_GOSAR|nr:putative ybgA [Gossypium arboreum]
MSFHITVPAFDDSSLVALADFSLVRGEHNLEHHPTDATSEWRTIFDAKISPPTSRTTSPEVDLKECWSNVASNQQQKRRHYSLVPRLKTQDTVEIYGYYLPHSEDTEDNELL